ncbi:MAG TPA: type IX secretion system membrane protein PorP/SprF [Flavobacterium sp.]|jgi:type IX secretion system PorP/SprF family membrane protein
MKAFRKYFSFSAFLVFAAATAQQDPQFTHYMYNMSVINPAYSTDNPGVISLGGLYRTQWVGAVGAPKTATFFVHSPVAKRVEAGISIVSDEIGDVVKETNLFADIAYVIPVSANNKLSFGVKGGLTFFDANFNGFQYSDANPDPAFAENINRTFPNVGAGTYFFSDHYYLGFSAPNLLRTKHLEHQDAISTIGVEEVHYFFTGGYVFNLAERWKLKPAFMAKSVSGAPMTFDVTANVLFNNFFEVGAGYRVGDAVSGLVNIYITPTLRAGYSYDYTLSNLGEYNSGTHEIFLLFDLDLSGISKKGYDKSPRFF